MAVGPFIQVFASTDYVITQQLHVLTSSTAMNAAMMDTSKVVYILPEPRSISLAIASVVKRFGWTDIAFLAQDDFSPMLALAQSNINVWPIRLSNFVSSSEDPELQRNLLSLRQSEKSQFILHSNDRNVVLHVLQAARRLHLLHSSTQWFITFLDFEDIVEGHNITWPGSMVGLQLLHKEMIPRNLSHLLSPEMSRLDLGLAVDVVGLLRHILWIEAGDCTRERISQDYVIPPEAFTWQLKNKTYPYHGALGRYIWDRKNNRRTSFSIDVMHYENAVTKLGSILFENGSLTVIARNSMFNMTRDTKVFDRDDVLMIATKQTDPFVIKREDGTYAGFSVDLLEELAKKLNFSYKLFEVKDFQTAEGGNINGMVFALTSGNASMAVGAMEVTAEREEVISFSYTILSSQASILIKKAESTRNFFQFLGPFSTWLWLMILVFIVVASICLFIMSRFDPTQEGNEQRFDLKESIWYSCNIVLQGTTDYSPSTTSMRAIIAFFWFCVLVIDAAYTANLAAYLTLQQMDDRIKNVHDLSAQTSLKYGVERDTDVMLFFQSQREDPFERMWGFMKVHEKDTILSNTSEIIARVKDGKLAFISDGVTNEYYSYNHCGIESIEQNFGRKDFSLGIPRGAPYLNDINHALLQLKEEGVLDHLKGKWWSTKNKCPGDDDTRSIGQKTTAVLELTNMTGVFIVLAFFIGISIMVDIASRFYSYRVDKKTKPTEGVEMSSTDAVNGVDNFCG